MMMVSVTKFAGSVSQTTGGHFVSFDNLNNIKNSAENSHAVSSILIQGKSESKNRPSTISGTNFNFNLPVGAEPTRVVVTYRHRKVYGSDYTTKNKHMLNIPAPTISLLGVSDFSGKGVATTTTMTTHTKSFSVAGKVSRTQVNSNSFGFKINYPTNSNKWNGYLRVSYVKVTVEYKVPSYSVNVSKVEGGYNEEDYVVKLSISNKNWTSFNPTLTLVSPLGFSFKSKRSGEGVVSQVNARTLSWNPKLSSKVGTSNVELVFSTNVIYPSGQSSYTGTFTLSENLNSTTSSHSATITDRPVTEEDSQGVPYDEEIIPNNFNYRVLVSTNEEKNYVEFDTTQIQTVNPLKNFLISYLEIYSTAEIKVDTEDENTYTINSSRTFIPLQDLPNDNPRLLTETLKFYSLTPTGATVQIHCKSIQLHRNTSLNYWEIYNSTFQTYEQYDNDYYSSYCGYDNVYVPTQDEVRVIEIDFIPPEETVDGYNPPYLSIVEPTEEELDRLGSGYTYICQSDIKHTTSDTNARDWYKNNRIGVFNNAISDNITIVETEDPETGEIIETITDSTDYENLTFEEIFTNAEYWSENTAGLNTYENVECEFPYNENYPLYIIFTGDYPEATDYGYDKGTITYTEPCIIEKTVYTDREQNGNYPFPISNLITVEGIAEVSIPNQNPSSPIIFYDYPLDEEWGTDDTHSIRGIEVTGQIEQSDELILSAKLISPNGATGSRTIVINDANINLEGINEFKIGGLGDLWGFKTSDLTNLKDWEIQLFVNNILLDDVANLNFGSIQVTFYIETLQKQKINVKIEGEDLSYYGAFIQEVEIPEGLETDTSFLTIDGTDTNDAYRQNIREKNISLKMSIGECDIKTSTDMLRQLTKLLVNQKDEYNRPIPNRIEFSHYPDVYFEYIMENPLDIKTNISEYEITADLTIPAGTSYSKQETTTNINGFVQGLAAVNPIITFKPQAAEVTISETLTGQSFHMGYTGDWQSKIVEINCEDRVVLLKTSEDDSFPVDITKYVDFNSDWFNLYGEYVLNGVGCIIRTCTFNERW